MTTAMTSHLEQNWKTCRGGFAYESSIYELNTLSINILSALFMYKII